MELGANKRSLTQLAVALTILAGVVYYQFFRSSGGSPQPHPSNVPFVTSESAPTVRSEFRAASRRSPRSGRFQPRIGRPASETQLDPLTADATLRSDLLKRIRSIEMPSVERDIFNFGPPPKRAQVLTPTATQLAQSRLNEALRKPMRAEPAGRAKKVPPRVRAPAWKYFGLASRPGSDAHRAFLLDDEEILVGAEGSVLQDRYRIAHIGLEAVVLKDLQSEQEFSIALEAPR